MSSNSVVYIVDDDKAIRIPLKTYLKAFEIKQVSNGAELPGAAEDFHPDLIITDVIMPGLSGWRAVKEIRKNPDFIKIPVVFASGFIKDQSIYEMQRPDGPAEFMLKPFKKKDLLKIIEKYFIIDPEEI